MNQKGYSPLLIVILIAAVIGGYLIYSGRVNLNKSQDKTTSTEQNNSYPTELQGYPIYPKAKFIKKEAKTPSDYTNCEKSDPRIIACNYNTMNYIFSIDESYNYENTSNNNFYKWYNDSNNLLGWKKNGGAQGISGYDKGNESFDLLYGGDSGKIEITIRIPTKNGTKSTSDETDNWKVYTNSQVGITAKYPSDWTVSQSIFISQVPFTAGNQDKTKTYNIISFQKYPTQIYEELSNQQLFNKINDFDVDQSVTDQRVIKTKLTSGETMTGENYVIFTAKPSSTFVGDSFNQVKAYITKGQTIYQITLDQYDGSGLDIFKQLIPTISIN